MMLGLLLARAGLHVTVLEKHRDFLRDFRGDTIHPSTLQLLHERLVRRWRVHVETMTDQHRHSPFAGELARLSDETALARTRLPGHEHHPSLARHRPRHLLCDQLAFVDPAHERPVHERRDEAQADRDVEARPLRRGRLAPDRVERDPDPEAADREREPRAHQDEQQALDLMVAMALGIHLMGLRSPSARCARRFAALASRSCLRS